MVRILPVSLAVVLLLAGCGAVASPGENMSGEPVPVPSPSPSQELIGQGTVISDEDGPVMFCLGPVLESYPPQCSGPQIIGWDWADVRHSETAGGVTWGTYAVQGTWDGDAFTVTQPAIPLALYDPPANLDPRTDPANPGAGSPAELELLQQELQQAEQPDLLESWIENGYLFVTVVYDDGTLQEAFDARYGPDLIAVRSALKPVNSS